jgi:uncharacterized protein YjaG (DUF416 family)
MPIEKINELKGLGFTKQAAFAYLACERLYPNYVYFSENYGFGDPNVLRAAIDFLHDNLFEESIDKNKIDSHIKAVEKNTPDTEDFSVIFVSSALDACTCILDSLSFLLKQDFLKITYISSYGIDSVDMYIRETEGIGASDKNFRQRVDEHPLMTKEISIQQGIVTFLCNTNSIDYGDMQTLLHLQEKNKKGSLGL